MEKCLRIFVCCCVFVTVVSATCREGEEGACLSCEDSYFLNGLRCEKCSTYCEKCFNLGHCIKCVQGFGVHRGYCSPCHKGCEFCEFYRNDERCWRCLPGHILLNDNLCDPCPANCYKCSSPKTCDDCNGSSFKDKTTSLCVTCPDRCTSCGSSESCTACQSGFYGSLCKDKCPNGCLSNTCGKETGNCSCRAGFYGHMCEKECLKNCLDNTCQKDTGHCHCTGGFYGTECDNKCPSGCINNSCDKDTGNCLCKTGFYGSACKNACSSGCLNNICQRDTGFCPCKTGFYGPGCSDRCPQNCVYCDLRQNCSTCQDDDLMVCEVCKDGKLGKLCNEDCSNNCKACDSEGHCTVCNQGFYGRGCKSSCSTGCFNGTCLLDTGMCIGGCVNDTEGPYCLDLIQGFSLVPVLVGIAGVSAVFVVVVIVIIAYTFKLKMDSKETNDGDRKDAVRKQANEIFAERDERPDSYYLIHELATTSNENEYAGINLPESKGYSVPEKYYQQLKSEYSELSSRVETDLKADREGDSECTAQDDVTPEESLYIEPI